ncbi:MAG: phosphoenolpyruvate hydrolase family protein [Pseudomonadota bacterium]
MLDTSEFLVGVTVGSGAVASIATRSGADFLLAINAARLRNMGAPSISCMLPLADAVSLVDDYAATDVLPLVTQPVFAGMTCWQTDFNAQAQTRRLLEEGFAGVVNFPPSALYPPEIQRNLERAGVGFAAEIEMLRAAQNAGGLALAYCYNISQCRQAAIAGIGHILLNLGWNTGGLTSPSAQVSLEEAAALAVSATRQIRRISPDAIVLLEGGPVETSEDLAFIREFAQLDGYVGGSTFERLPIERAITDRIATFKAADRTERPEDRHAQRVMSLGKRAGLVVESAAMTDALGAIFEARRRGQPMTYIQVPLGESFQPVERFIEAQLPRAVTAIRLEAGPDLGASQALKPLASMRGHPRRNGPGAGQSAAVLLRHPERLTETDRQTLSDLILDLGPGDGQSQVTVFLLSHEAVSDLPQSLQDSPLGALIRAYHVAMPGLHERVADIPALIDQILADGTRKTRASHLVSPGAMRRLQGYAWRANTAELTEVCARLAPLMSKGLIGSKQIDDLLRPGASVRTEATTAVSQEKQILISVLAQNRFRKGQTADALGISRKTLYNRMKRHGLS